MASCWKTSSRIVVGLASILVSGTAPVYGQCELPEVAKLTAALPDYEDHLGISVSLTDSLAVVGAHQPGFEDQHNPIPAEEGFALVFRFDGENWIEEARLVASDGEVGDHFGESIATNGDYILVGAPARDDPSQNVCPTCDDGGAYVFRYDGSEWVETQAVFPSPAGEPVYQVGRAVAMDGNTMVIGTDGTSLSGGAFAYRLVDEIWVQEAQLFPSSFSPTFGEAVAIQGGIAVVGVRWDDDVGSNAGAAYIFRFDGVSWTEDAKLVAPDPEANTWFGTGVAVYGSRVFVGAPHVGFASGAVYVFSFDGSTWCFEDKLLAIDASHSERMGWSVAATEGLVVAGGFLPFQIAGAAYVYRFDDPVWIPEAKLIPIPPRHGFDAGLFGIDVAVSGNMALVGMPNTSPICGDGDDCDSGTAYIYRGLADCDGSGVLDACEILAVPEIDCDQNWVPDTCDVDCNVNGSTDACDITNGVSLDCQGDGVPDECQLIDNDSVPPGGDGIPDDCNCAIDADCDDGHACDGAETCLLPQAVCELGVPDDSLCNDGILCTLDQCDPYYGCLFDDAALDWVACGLGENGICVSGLCREECAAEALAGLTVADAEANQRFGWAAAVDDDVAIFSTKNSIATYVFREAEGAWIEEQKLTPSEAESDAEFGFSVAIAGLVAAIGAPGDQNDVGSVFVFWDNEGTWTEVAKLAADAPGSIRFGETVAVQGDVIAVGAPLFGPPDVGAAVVFRRVDTDWIEEAIISPGDLDSYDRFGTSVSLSGEYLLIGAPGDDDEGPDGGAVYVFNYDGLKWIETSKITLIKPWGNFLDEFGTSVALDGTRALIGVGPFFGSAYLFEFDGTDWTRTADIYAPGGITSFGSEVALRGNVAVVGAWESSAAFLYRIVDGAVVEEVRLSPQLPGRGGWMGRAVATNGKTVLVGAPLADFPATNAGMVHVFAGPADCNETDTVDVCDIADGFADDVNNNGIPDECEDFVAAPAVVSEGARYLAVTPEPSASPVALWVTSETWPCVDAFVDFDPDLELADMGIGRLVDQPVFLLPEEWGTVHVSDMQIVPDSSYAFHAYVGPDAVSDPTIATTWLWGDGDDSGVIDFDDVVCVLDGFAGSFEPCGFFGEDLAGPVTNGIIDIDDLLAALDAYADNSYPWPGPCP